MESIEKWQQQHFFATKILVQTATKKIHPKKNKQKIILQNTNKTQVKLNNAIFVKI